MQDVKRCFGIVSVLALVFSSFFLYSHPDPVSAATANHVVISEVQVQGATTTDEFVELYNPTANPIDLTGWRLTKRTAFSVADDNLVGSMSGTIPAHGFFLIAHVNYDGAPAADQLYTDASNSIANNNSVHLYSDNGVTTVDKVGMGSSINNEGGEGFSVPIPVTDQSIERKAQADSDQISLSVGGAHAVLGNAEDTDVNLNDFITRLTPLPQSSASGLEVPSGDIPPTPTATVAPSPTSTPIPTQPPTPTPTDTVTPTPTVSVSPSPSPIPTATPTITPTPSVTVVPTPTESLTPTPTVSVTPTVTTTPSPTPTTTVSPSPTGTPVPTSTPAPTPTPAPDDDVAVETPFIICHRRTLSFKTLFGTINFPILHCMIK